MSYDMVPAKSVLRGSFLMHTNLHQIHDWQQKANQAGWSVKKMADNCGVSVRSLERFFVKNMGLTPKEWMKGCRHSQSIELFKDGSSIKETWLELGYKHSTHLARDFKKHWGCCPKQFNLHLKTKTFNAPPPPPTP